MHLNAAVSLRHTAKPVNEPQAPVSATGLAVVVVGSLITVGFMGSVIVSPLYPLYQEKFGFSEITLTLVYSAYVVGNIAALLCFGQISDRVGRRRVSLPALGLAGVSALVFLFAGGTVSLALGRFLIGLAVGVLSGTGTAWLAELYGPERRSTATVAAATANLMGVAIGPLLGGFLAQYGPAPLRLPFVVYVAILGAVVVAISRMHEPTRDRVGFRDLKVRPRVGVPRRDVNAFVPPAVTGFVIFALGGLYFALIPAILAHGLHDRNAAVAGAIVSELAVFSITVLFLGRRLASSAAMSAGLVVLLPAVALIVAAQAAGSVSLLVIASAVGGVSLALGYRGSLQVVNELAPDDRRAEVVSAYYLACFLGNSLPVIGVGILSTIADPLVASTVFAIIVGMLASGSLVWHRTVSTVDSTG